MTTTHERSKWVRKLQWAGVFIVSLFFVTLTSDPLRAENERVVTVFRDGVEQTIVTDAATVGEALSRAQVTLNEHDTVEPAAETKLVAPGYNVNVYRARPVTVVDGMQRYTVMTSHTSAGKIAAAAGLNLYAEDNYTLDRIDDFVSEGGMGLKMTIDRATLMRLVLYGTVTEVRTQADTIGELMAEKKIVLAGEDGANLDPNTPVTAGTSFEVWRNGVQTATNEEEINFTTKQVRDNDKPSGYRAIQTPGVKGKKMVTYEIEMKNGREVSRKQIQSVTTQEPKEQVEIIGQTGFTGAFGEALAKLRACESGGNYANKRNPTYRGAYQFGYGTWANYGGYYDPADAPPAVQDQAAHDLYKRRGWQPWPACSKKLGLQDIYR